MQVVCTVCVFFFVFAMVCDGCISTYVYACARIGETRTEERKKDQSRTSVERNDRWHMSIFLVDAMVLESFFSQRDNVCASFCNCK